MNNTTLRVANKNDVELIFNWANDSLVRKNSYDSNRIKLEDHKKWFFKKIKDRSILFLIALVNNKPAGLVRFAIGEEYSVVGVLVSKAYRGQKLASEFLKESSRNYFETYSQPILAYIKDINKASIKSFENAEYVYFTEEKIDECTSFVYKLERKDVKE